MSLSGALSNAMSGLAANARGTSIVSSNIANAMTESYTSRTLVLASDAAQTHGGVRVAAVTRDSSPVLSQEKRLALADHAGTQVLATYSARAEALWGSVDTAGSVAEKLTRFETALLSAEADPSSATGLRAVAQAAESLTEAIRAASDGIQRAREEADAGIARSVSRINTGLAEVHDLNRKILSAKHGGQDVSGLLDRRDAVLDRISEEVPLRVIDRDNGTVSVFSERGHTMLDGRPAKLDFSPTHVIVPHMTQGNGLLSGLSLDGRPVDGGASGLLAGGGLSAKFEVRDSLAVRDQAVMDAIARDLAERFGSAGPDSTIASGAPGVFTDDGLAVSPANETGLAGRLQLNAALSPDVTDAWKWRSGMNAVLPAEAGDSSLLRDLRLALSARTPPASTELPSGPASLIDHVGGLSNRLAADRLDTHRAQETASARKQNAREAIATTGVDTDRELHNLIELEKNYAANARVVRVVDDMLQDLLNI